MSDQILLKLGGSVLTDKGSPGVVDRAAMERIAKDLAAYAQGSLCIVHGAGSFGHPEAHRYGIAHGSQSPHVREGIALTHGAVCTLNGTLVGVLRGAGIPAIGIHPLGSAWASNGALVALETRPIAALMALGLVPVLHGDVVMDGTRGTTIVSGDQIVRFLAEKVPFTRVGLATDVPGVLGPDGRVIQEIGWDDGRVVHVGRSSYTDVTGGMGGKLRELQELAKKGTTSDIFHVSRLADFLEGRPHGGTSVKGREVTWTRND
ncbi:MAG: isopentenyl phosphate kinase [Methanolinea sp.]|nr:isopentenyl phosphate kinase [Methanolinea sp.]